MQPYLLPYIGYWQLLAAVDRFVLYDNIEYTKQSWINRNRLLRNGVAVFFTVPLKRASDTLCVSERLIADEFDAPKMLRQFAGSYGKAPYFSAAFPVIERVLRLESKNLFEYIHHSIKVISDFLDIRTPIVVSSTIDIDHRLKAEHKVLALCRALEATIYVNAPGGRALYSKPAFAAEGIDLRFLAPRLTAYRQFDHPFVPALSIVDAMMFNSRDELRAMVTQYDLT
jgi:hypothetical protein